MYLALKLDAVALTLPHCPFFQFTKVHYLMTLSIILSLLQFLLKTGSCKLNKFLAENGVDQVVIHIRCVKSFCLDCVPKGVKFAIQISYCCSLFVLISGYLFLLTFTEF